MNRTKIAALSIFAATSLFCQNPSSTAPSDAWRAVPEITVQTEDYAAVRNRFHTKLLKSGPAPEQVCDDSKAPDGASAVAFPSGNLRLKAWIGFPKKNSARRFPAVLFLHGGFCFDISDWQVTQIFRDAGFAVMSPVLRGEEGQPGNFTMFYDEVDDVMGAAEYLRHQPDIDNTRIYLAGHSTGGTLTMLTAMADPHFAAAASFSGSPDAVGYTRHALVSGG